jgi:hypothetical protein
MISRTFYAAVTLAVMLSGASTSPIFARDGGAAAGAAAGASAGGGNGGPHDLSLEREPQIRRAFVFHGDRNGCGLGPAESGFFGPERQMFAQICADEL